MKPIIKVVPNALTISLDIKDINGNETLTFGEVNYLVDYYHGYIDGDLHAIVIPIKSKVKK